MPSPPAFDDYRRRGDAVDLDVKDADEDFRDADDFGDLNDDAELELLELARQ